MDLEQGARQIEAERGRLSEGERLHRLLDLHWRYTMEEAPEFATYVGWLGHDHRWSDLSLEAIDRRNREMEIPSRVLDGIDRGALSAADRLHRDLFRRNLDEAMEGRRFKGEYMPLNQMQGIQ